VLVADVGGSVGDGLEEISESTNINGDTNTFPGTPHGIDCVMNLDDGIFSLPRAGRRCGSAASLVARRLAECSVLSLPVP